MPESQLCQQDSHEWVTEELLPRLEAETPRLRCCIHDRDFKVGVTVIENIVDCIDRSRKFAMIVTRGFEKSKWCRFETHLAHTRMLNSDENNLVVVIKDKVEISDKSLRLLVRSWKPLEWNSRDRDRDPNLFWTRLRSAIMKTNSGSFKIPTYSNHI